MRFMSCCTACRPCSVTCFCLQAGYVHRDLRWENTACTLQHRHFLLDLEQSGKPGVPGFRLSTWSNGMLPGGAYTMASDLIAVGDMLIKNGNVRSTLGTAFMQQLKHASDEAGPTAAGLLDHEWIGCCGHGCTAAGGLDTV